MPFVGAVGVDEVAKKYLHKLSTNTRIECGAVVQFPSLTLTFWSRNSRVNTLAYVTNTLLPPLNQRKTLTEIICLKYKKSIDKC